VRRDWHLRKKPELRIGGNYEDNSFLFADGFDALSQAVFLTAHPVD
jgi:hypothetical protein